ncbi:hypothetical protein C7212DRAFT_365567 [Tuber magnatum]|uniref:Hydrophobin n=1 Tax=Tuber magnatum TaxID=42249 RepID=A0A317SHJ7_9PEZI|nr:hypothetical protein C7212DRAFT_365567 [Tuber magnatum]
MRFSIISIIALALSAAVTPLIAPDSNQDVGNKGQNAGNSAANKGQITGGYAIQQGVQTCGNAQLNCCNKIEKGDTTNAGLLGVMFGSGDIGIQCSPINIPVIGIPIHKVCDAKAACCQGEVSQNGLINLGCLALASII